MGANVFSRHRTQRDPVRFSSQVRAPGSTQSDGARQLRNSLTQRRSLVQIQ